MVGGVPRSSSQNDNDLVSPELHHTTDQDPVPCWALVHGHWPNHPGEVSKQGNCWESSNTLARSHHLSHSIRLSGSSPQQWPLTFHNRENRGELSDPSLSLQRTNAPPSYYSWEPSPTPFSPPPCMGTRSGELECMQQLSANLRRWRWGPDKMNS